MTRTIEALGYPSIGLLSTWLTERGRRQRRMSKSPERLLALKRVYIDGENIHDVADELKCDVRTISNWRSDHLRAHPDRQDPLTRGLREKVTGMGKKKKAPDRPKDAQGRIRELEEQVQEMRMELDIMHEIYKVLKKDRGISQSGLTTKEMVVVTDALKKQYPLKRLLNHLGIAKSTYFDAKASLNKGDKYEEARELIRDIYEGNFSCYGYRRIYRDLKVVGITLSEKVVRRLMKEEGIMPKKKRMRPYSSYRGEVGAEAENLLKRNFTASAPNQSWVTDITEFKLDKQKVYLSAIIDLYDRLPIAWTMSTSPTVKLATDMLETAVSQLKEEEKPLVHSDRGFHYRNPAWLKIIEKHQLTRSMSKKGCSPDNAACEGFWGRVKTEMFYTRSWTGISASEFMAYLDMYLKWYQNKRMSNVFGMSLMENRRRMGVAS